MKAILPIRRSFGIGATLLLLGACAPTVSQHGHRLDAALLAQIQPGVTSQEEVTRLLGSPSSTGTFDGQTWYYVSQRSEQRSFYQEKIAAQDVYRIDFDQSGIVKDVSDRNLRMARAIEPSTQTTRTLGNELSIVQQFVGNIGRFNSAPPDPASQAAGSAGRR